MTTTNFASVPPADPSATIDPHWLALRGEQSMPVAYLPPSMPGPRSRTSRVLAAAIVAVFVVATAAGVCLTYGPDPFGIGK